MGISDWFKKSGSKGPDPIHLKLSRMEEGYVVDYDMKSWQVTAHHQYDWGEGDVTQEWQLRSADDVVYLELESDDEDDWSLNRKIPFNNLGSGIKDHIKSKGDPPDTIVFEGVTYYMEETAGGHFLKDGRPPGRPLLRWSYEDDAGKRYLGIEQWEEDEFEASAGHPVQEYQFTNILPGAR